MPAVYQNSEPVERIMMGGSKYSLAGWLSLVAAVLFPISFVLGIVQGIVGARAFDYRGPVLGPADGISILYTGIIIYVFIMFRRLLNERYEFHEIDTLITLNIAWSAIFGVLAIGMKVLIALLWPLSELALILIQGSFFVVAMLTMGVIDIIMGVRIIKAKVEFTDLIRALGAITLVAGIAEATVLLGVLVLPLIPVICVILGLILLRDKHAADFV